MNNIITEVLTHWKRPWCWERLRAGGEGDDRGWDGWMASPTHWTWDWVNSWSWWWAGKPGVLRFMGSQRVGHDWVTNLNWWRTRSESSWRWLTSPDFNWVVKKATQIRNSQNMKTKESVFYKPGSKKKKKLKNQKCKKRKNSPWYWIR